MVSVIIAQAFVKEVKPTVNTKSEKSNYTFIQGIRSFDSRLKVFLIVSSISHSSNGTVIKTSSYPLGFTANKTGIIQLLTNIPIAIAKNITTETFLTDLNQTSVLSNPVKTLPTQSSLIKSSEFTPTVIKNKT